MNPLTTGHSQARKLFAVGAVGAAAAVAFLGGYLLENFDVRVLMMVVLGITGLTVVSLPYDKALVALFVYVGFEGMAKIITGYNPIVHVGVDLLVFILTARWFMGYLLRQNFLPEKYPPLIRLFALHWIWFVIQCFNPFALSLFASIAGSKIYVTMPLLYFYGYYLVSSPERARQFMKPWVIILAIEVVLSLQQSSIGPASVLSISKNYAAPLEKFRGYAFRPFGTTAVAGGPSILISMAIPFVMYFFVAGRGAIARGFAVVALPGSAMALLLCQIRAALMKSIIGAALFIGMGVRQAEPRVRARVIGGTLAGAIALIFLMPALTSRWTAGQNDNARAIQRSLTLFDFEKSSGARAHALEIIMRYAQEAPLGAGLSRTGAAAGKFADLIATDPYYRGVFFTDNFWAAVIVDLGIPGAIIITILLVRILWGGYAAGRRLRNPDLALINTTLVAALFPMFIGLWGSEGLLYNPDASFFWFFGGALMRLPSLDAKMKS